MADDTTVEEAAVVSSSAAGFTLGPPAGGSDPLTAWGRREDVVRRLLDRGLSPRTLSVLLPEWHETILAVSARR